VDIDNQKIRFEGEWLGRTELAERIRKMIDNQDFRIGMAGAALEYLQNSISNARQLEVRMTAAEIDTLQKHSDRAGISLTAFVRQAIQAYLAAQPPLEEAQPQPGAQSAVITTEPVNPGEEAQAVELTAKKDQSSAKVLVDPQINTESHAPEGQGGQAESGWFKK
jgi:hypothetical protein